MVKQSGFDSCSGVTPLNNRKAPNSTQAADPPAAFHRYQGLGVSKGVLFEMGRNGRKFFEKILNFPGEQPIMSMKANSVLLFPKVHLLEQKVEFGPRKREKGGCGGQAYAEPSRRGEIGGSVQHHQSSPVPHAGAGGIHRIFLFQGR